MYVLTIWTHHWDEYAHGPDNVDVKTHVFRSRKGAHKFACRKLDAWKKRVMDFENIDDDDSEFCKEHVSRWLVYAHFDALLYRHEFNAFMTVAAVE